MLRFLRGPILGVISFLMYGIFMLLLAVLTLSLALIRFIPIRWLQKCITNIIHYIPTWWSDGVGFIMDLGGKIEWNVSGGKNLREDDWYLMIANHRSWLDIMVLQRAFNHKIPSLRFFMKKELIWQLPLIGYACMVLGCPIMKKHSKATLEKNPHLKGSDIEATREACDKFKNIPITMINFVEGGRFCKKKHKKQRSPYRYLLKPKAGGIAFLLATMGKYLHQIINTTIIYPNMNTSLWDFACGRVDKVTVNIQTIPIGKELLGDYANDAHFRSFFQYWLNELWMEKDKFMVNTIDKDAASVSSDSDSDPDDDISEMVT